MIQIVVTLEEDGRLTVSGAILNKAMAYGMLELAKDAIRAMESAKPPGIVPVRLMPGNGGPPPGS